MKKKLLLGATVLAIALLSIAYATSLLYYDWTVNMTGATPKVMFYKWSDQTNATTITLSLNIYDSMWLINDNATYGIKNWNTAAKTVYMWVESCNATTWFANYTIQILDTTGAVKATWTTTNFASIGEASAVSWSHTAGEAWTIKILYKGTASVVVGNVAQVQMKLKAQE